MMMFKYTKTKKAWIALGLLAYGVVGISAVSIAQTPGDLMNRLGRLENEIQTLNRAVYKNDADAMASIANGQTASDGKARAQTEIRFQEIERQISELRGLVEQQGYETRTLTQKLERVTGDIELRLSDLERVKSTANVPTSATTTVYESPSNNAVQGQQSPNDPPPPPVTVSSPPNTSSTFGALPSASPPQARSTSSSGTLSTNDNAAAAYENAFALLKAGQYDNAGGEFLSFLNLYPDHVLAGNAKYWLGETFYVQGDYERAARIFAEGYKDYPKGAKTPDNLLKLGLSLASLKNSDDACVAFAQLETDFGKTQTPAASRGRAEAQKIGCNS